MLNLFVRVALVGVHGVPDGVSFCREPGLTLDHATSTAVTVVFALPNTPCLILRDSLSVTIRTCHMVDGWDVTVGSVERQREGGGECTFMPHNQHRIKTRYLSVDEHAPNPLKTGTWRCSPRTLAVNRMC